MSKITDSRTAFRELHREGCFAIPNPWDIGSAKYLQSLGFKALASTSSGFAFAKGMADYGDAVTRELVLGHIAEISAAVEIPVNADYQSGYGATLEELAESVRQCIASGVAGFSLEDSNGNSDKPLFDVEEATERIRVARRVIDESGEDVLLTGRAECFLFPNADNLQDSIRRLQAYAEAGADVLFAPGVRGKDHIKAIVSAVSPLPVNVLIGADIGFKMSDLADLGVRRVSVGSALARVAWGGFMRAAQALASEGSFAGFEGMASNRDLNSLFRA